MSAGGRGIGTLNVSVIASTGKAVNEIHKFRAAINSVPKAASAASASTGIVSAAIAGFGVTVAAATFNIRQAIAGIKQLDNVAKTSDKLGIATEKLAGLRLAAEESGVASNTLDMALQRMVRRVSEAAVGTGEAQGALRELGIDAKALASLAPDEQFRAIADAMGRVGPQADKVRLAFKLFDSEGVALVNTLKIGREGLDATQKAAAGLGIAIDREAIRKLEQANDAMGRVGKAADGVQNSLAILLAPAIEKVANVATGFLSELAAWPRHLGLVESATNDVADAMRAKQEAAQREAIATAAQTAANEKLTAAYREQADALRRRRLAAAEGEGAAAFRDDAGKFGRGRAIALQELRELAERDEKEQAQRDALAELRREVANFGKSSLRVRAEDFMRTSVADDIKAEARVLFDQLETLEAKKKEMEAADQARRKEQAEQERQAQKREQLRKRLFDAAGRSAPGLLDARTSEGYAQLRSSLRGTGVQERIAKASELQLGETRRTNDKLDALYAAFNLEVVSLQ